MAVTIRELRDPAGLQDSLRAAGVPATVRFSNQNPPACLYYPGPQARLSRLTREIFPDTGAAQIQNGAAFDIETSALPHDAGLWINVDAPQTGSGSQGASAVAFSVSEALVYRSGQCPSS